MVLLDPLPLRASAPGYLVSVQFPAGRPERTTLPVGTPHDGWVIVPTSGADGVAGCALIVTLAEGDETHPDWLVRVNV